MIWLYLALNSLAMLWLLRLWRKDRRELSLWQRNVTTTYNDAQEKHLAWQREVSQRCNPLFRDFERRIAELELNQERPSNKGAMKAPAKKRTVKAGK